jgi:hypothetical protein
LLGWKVRFIAHAFKFEYKEKGPPYEAAAVVRADSGEGA